MNMKFFGIFAVLGCVAVVNGAQASRSSMYSSVDMTNSDGDTIRVNRSYYESRPDYRYNRPQPQRVSRAGIYDNLETSHHYQRVEEPVQKEIETKQTYTAGKTYRKSAKRKYFIANPFYQPLQFQFGSVTTGEYMQGKYNFGNIAGSVDRKLTELSLKEDLSFGLTDRIALQVMGKYNRDKLTWTDTAGAGADEYKSNGLNVYGIGLQGRIVDTTEWIATVSGYYEHQKHGIDYLIGDLKVGYKVATSTIYGLGRAWVVNMDGDVYGDYLENASTNEWGMLVYGDSRDALFMGELGMGVWTVLAEDWTLNVEGLYGFYDWHDQFSIKGAFGWQPNDWFALNLYAKTSLYDTADKKTLVVHDGTLPVTAAEFNDPAHYAYVDLSKYHEWSVGLQVMFQF